VGSSFTRVCRTLLFILLVALSIGYPSSRLRFSGGSLLWAAEDLPVAPEDERWLRRKPEVARVIIGGNEHVSERDIRRRMELNPSSAWATFGLRRKNRVLHGAWERDRRAIIDLLETYGFLQAKVVINIRQDEKNKRAIVEVFVNEGPRTVWGKLTVTGEKRELSGKTYRWLKELKRGEPANPRLLRRTCGLCQSAYADYGYPYARFVASLQIDSTKWDTAHIAITVDPGPQVHFGQVEVVGNTYTKTGVVRRELAFKPGDLYSRRKIIESQNNIYRTGLFTFTRLQVKVDSIDTIAGQDPDFNVKVVERKPSYVEATTGAGQDEHYDLTWDYSLEWGTRNWFGTGRRWALQAKSEFRTVPDHLTKWTVLYHRFAARYTEPWIFGLRLPTTLEFTYEPGVRSDVQPYRIEKMGGALSFHTWSGLTKKAWLSLVYENVNIYGIDDPQQRQDILEEAGISITRKIVWAIEKDSRPNIFVPTSGSLTRLDAEYAGGFLGGDVGFYKVVGSWARYQTVAASVLASRLKFGWVKKAGRQKRAVPTIDRFYLGGANSIRGYQENSVGPMTAGAPAGGGVMGVVNLELRTPVIWKLWFTVFGDAGNNWVRFSDMDPEDILVSLGVGLQYVSPVGPLRLDYARRVVHPGHPTSDRLHLAILFSF